MRRNVYILMWVEEGFGTTRERAMFAGPLTRKRQALKEAKIRRADVYAIPYPGGGWDCPTVRAVFEPIAVGGKRV
jgi:hypothetical protein